MTTVLKLGGSVITDKDCRETVDLPALEATASAVADAGVEDLVIVHGGGSYGHFHADEHGVSTTDGTHDAHAARSIHGAMKRLNGHVLDAFGQRDVPVVPVHPFSVAARNETGTLSLPLDSVRTLLDEGFVPVLHGDAVAHAGEGVTILSGDELVVRLATGLGADRVGVCSTVPGVLDTNDDVVPEIQNFEDIAAALGASESTDVTGGMAAKVRALLDLGAPAHVFGPDGLDAFLSGESPGTRIEG